MSLCFLLTCGDLCLKWHLQQSHMDTSLPLQSPGKTILLLLGILGVILKVLKETENCGIYLCLICLISCGGY